MQGGNDTPEIFFLFGFPGLALGLLSSFAVSHRNSSKKMTSILAQKQIEHI